MWKQERDQMQKLIFDKDEEIESLKEQLEKQKQQMNKVLKLVDQVIACRPPPRIYSVCLKGPIFVISIDDENKRC